MGSSNISTHSYFTFFFIVAVNNEIYLSGLIYPNIDLIYYSKPRENKLSASSITTYVHLCIFVAFFFIISINLPGVATIISTPDLNSFH